MKHQTKISAISQAMPACATLIFGIALSTWLGSISGQARQVFEVKPLSAQASMQLIGMPLVDARESQPGDRFVIGLAKRDQAGAKSQVDRESQKGIVRSAIFRMPSRDATHISQQAIM